MSIVPPVMPPLHAPLPLAVKVPAMVRRLREVGAGDGEDVGTVQIAEAEAAARRGHWVGEAVAVAATD